MTEAEEYFEERAAIMEYDGDLPEQKQNVEHRKKHRANTE
jgi:hypothetical protein